MESLLSLLARFHRESFMPEELNEYKVGRAWTVGGRPKTRKQKYGTRYTFLLRLDQSWLLPPGSSQVVPRLSCPRRSFPAAQIQPWGRDPGPSWVCADGLTA